MHLGVMGSQYLVAETTSAPATTLNRTVKKPKFSWNIVVGVPFREMGVILGDGEETAVAVYSRAIEARNADGKVVVAVLVGSVGDLQSNSTS